MTPEQFQRLTKVGRSVVEIAPSRMYAGNVVLRVNSQHMSLDELQQLVDIARGLLGVSAANASDEGAPH